MIRPVLPLQHSAGQHTAWSCATMLSAQTQRSGALKTRIDSANRIHPWQCSWHCIPPRPTSQRRSMTGQAMGQAPAAAPAPTVTAQHLAALPFPPHPALIGSEPGSFAEGTISKRLPAILDTVLSDLQRLGATDQQFSSAEANAQLQAAAECVRQLQQDMRSNAALVPLQPLAASAAAANGGAAGGSYDSRLLGELTAWADAAVDAWASHSTAATWMQLPWLLVECYMYTRLQAMLAAQPALAAAQYDPFAVQKATAFTKSLGSVEEVAASTLRLVTAAEQAGSDDAVMRQGLFEAMQCSLWGNKTDLSLLVDAAKVGADGVSLAQEIQAAQRGSGGSGVKNLIVDKFEQVWACLQPQAPAPQVDIILDNAGLELYTDLCLADYLVASGLASKVVLHGKRLPWFVSDTMRSDFDWMLDTCEGSRPQQGSSADAGTSSSSSSSDGGWGAVQALGARWRGHVESGRWQFEEHPFWSSVIPFWWMQRVSPELWQQLTSSSSLLIFKGDLCYRKLAFDCRWPYTTPFPDALGPFRPGPLVTLRTLKADVIAGLSPGQGEELQQVDAQWLVNGRFGVVQFAGRQPGVGSGA